MGCSGGDTEGELEKKARRTYKLYELIGVAGMAAIGFGLVTGLSSYYKGYEEGRKAGVEEAQEQAPNGRQYHLLFSAEQTKDDAKFTYQLMVPLNKVYPGEIGEEPHIDTAQVFEKLIIEIADGVMVHYFDGNLNVEINNDFCRAGGSRDGLVDSIVVYQPDKGSSLLCRERDYDDNPTVFSRADARFNEIRRSSLF